MPEEIEVTTEQPGSALETSDNNQPPAEETRAERLVKMRAELDGAAPQGSPAPASAPQSAPQTAGLSREEMNALITEALKKDREALRREIGQGNILPKRLQGMAEKVEAFEKRFQEMQQVKQPGVLATLSQEQRDAYKELIEAIWEEKYGQEWNALKEYKSDMEIQKMGSTIEGRARQMLGDKYDEIEPFAIQLFREASQAAQEGNEEADQAIDEIFKTRSGIVAFLGEAQRRYAQSLEAKNANVIAAQVKAGKAAGSVLGTASKGSGGKPTEMLADRPSPENRKDWLKAARGRIQHSDQ